MPHVISKRALGLINVLGGSLENLMPLTEFSSAYALRFPGFGRKTAAEVRAVLIDNDLDFKHYGGHTERGINPITGYSDKVDLFISTVTSKQKQPRASHPDSKTIKRLLASQKYYASGLNKTNATISNLNEIERNLK